MTSESGGQLGPDAAELGSFCRRLAEALASNTGRHGLKKKKLIYLSFLIRRR